jgi:putative flippase GtrA
MLRSIAGRSQFLGFVIAGGVAALANFGSRILLSEFLNYPTAILVAFLVGLATGFCLMRGHVFGASGRPLGHEIALFVMVNVLAVAQTLIVSLVLAYWVLPWFGVVAHAETVAHLVGVAVPLFTSYVAHKHWTFRPGAL